LNLTLNASLFFDVQNFLLVPFDSIWSTFHCERLSDCSLKVHNGGGEEELDWKLRRWRYPFDSVYSSHDF